MRFYADRLVYVIDMMNKKDFFPLILGSDENAYGIARLFNEKYGIKPLLLCTRELIPIMNSGILDVKIFANFDTAEVFKSVLRSELRRLHSEYEKLLVIPCSDYYARLAAENYDSFEGLIANRFIPGDMLDKVSVKDTFYALCEEHGLDYPVTRVCGFDERLTVIDDLGFDFPIVVKPENSNAVEYLHCSFNGQKKTFFMKNKEEYIGVITEMNKSGYRGNLILQKFIPGGDLTSRVINCYSDGNGKVRFMCIGNILLEEYVPNLIGNYAAIISGGDRKTYEKIEKFLNDIGYIGFSNFDLKYDSGTGEYLVLEMNPRLGRSSYYVRSAGHNVIEYLVEDFVYGRTKEPVYTYDEAVWSSVPRNVIMKYINNDEVKNKVQSVIKQKGLSHTLFNKEDTSPMRLLRILRLFLHQKERFRRYWFDKEKI